MEKRKIKQKHRIDVFHDFHRFGSGEHHDVKALAAVYRMENDGGGVIPGSNQCGAIYYGTKNNLLAFAEAVQEGGFRVDIEEF